MVDANTLLNPSSLNKKAPEARGDRGLNTIS